MKRGLRGFATLTALGLMILLSTLLVVGALGAAQVELGLKRGDTGRGEAWAVLDKALKVLGASWAPNTQTFAAWSAAHAVNGLEWESLSGKINLNTLSPFVLALPGFHDTLKDISVDKFVEARSLAGPSDAAFYKPLVQPEAMKAWYTVHSLWNINTADEVMLEAMANQRAGEGVGSALRATARSYREQKKRLSADDWARLSTSTALNPLVTAEPELDVNEAPETLLTALISNPAWAVTDAAAKVGQIVQTRTSQPWTLDKLKTLLQIPADNLLLSYLGVRTRFVGGSVTLAQGALDFVVYSPDGSPPRVVEAAWRTL